MVEWSLATVHEAVAGAVPQRDMLVWEAALPASAARRPTRRTYMEVAARTRAIAAFLAGNGLGATRERESLERWECGQSPVGLVMYNRPEYIESMLGSFRARCAPFNVNQHYAPAEIRQLAEMLGAEALIYQLSVADRVAEAAKLPRLLVHVDDGSGARPLPGSVNYESVISQHLGAGGDLPAPSPDDLYLVCTGGTTGRPKAVLWRQADIFVSAMGGSDAATLESLAEGARASPAIWFAAPPLMHGAAQWTAFSALHGGGTVVLHDDSKPFDARRILDTLEREHVNLIAIVGDAYAMPLIDELRRRRYDLSALKVLATGGATTSQAHKRALLELIPEVTIVDGYGASETGGMAFGATTASGMAGGFTPAAGAAVLSADRRRVLAPGDPEIGWTARRGRVPLGYLHDREKTEVTFPVIDGTRFSIPGDRATVGEDGVISVLGRDSLVINSGGEKVFVEEVEEVLRGHPEVVDALVVGRADERFGQEVVAVVQLKAGTLVRPRDLRDFVASSVARFKAPRAIAFTDRVARLASGKPDYRWAERVAEDAVSAVDG